MTRPAGALRRPVAGIALAALATIFGLAACSRSRHPPAAAQAAGPASLEPAPRTTAGAIAARNLDGNVQALERAVARRADDAAAIHQLVEHLLQRAEMLGRLADYDRALELADQLVAQAPDAAAFQLRARVRGRLHRFADALADLDEAARRGASAVDVDVARAGILQATGRLDEAAALRLRVPEPRPTLTTVAARAWLRADEGDTEGADDLFREALRLHKGVSPFPVAWLYFQQGLMWERAGSLARARPFYAAAVERLPGYAQAVSHLAGATAVPGDRARAIELLRPLLDSSDDPEYAGQLAQLLADDGQTEEAGRLRARAAAGYQALVARQPAAFADHAARFWLGPGGDPGRALALAEANLAIRTTDEAFALALDAAQAAAVDPAAGCALAGRALGLREPSGYLLFAAARAYRSCGRDDDADALLARVQTAKRPR